MPAALIDLDLLRGTRDWASWSALAADEPPYLSPEFFAINRPLTKGDRLLVAEAWAPGRMIGALPLALTGDTLRAMRSDYSPQFDYCGAPAGIDAIWDCLREDDRWNELVLDGIPVDSELATRLPMLARRDGHPVTVRPGGRHLYLPLPGFEAAMAAKFRANVQRCARKAGEVVLERIRVPSRADLDEAIAIEGMRWKGVAGTAIAADPRARHLYHVLARLFGRRGRASLYFLRVGGKRIATLFALEDLHTLFALKIGHDPQYANLSPGHLLVWKVAADAEQRGLRELDFVGREDEWKHKWTDLAHERVVVVIYQRSARGMARYGLREVVKPRLPATVRETPRSPLPRRCQRRDVVGGHTLVARIRGRLERGLGLKSGLRRALARTPARATLGQPSRFPVGSWVRVRDREVIAITLDDAGRARGLEFVPAQWDTCGKVHKVARHVRRLRDDHGRFRAVDATVLLDGVDCGGTAHEPGGCGRHCPLMYRDAWLEPASAPRAETAPAPGTRYARIRDVEEIYAGLDAFGRRDGLTFMPQMAAFAGRRAAIASALTSVFEYDRWIAPASPVYILRGLHCDGSITGARGPCDRACALMWHADWLVIEAGP